MGLAFGTFIRRRNTVVAVMAAEQQAVSMVSERDTAVRAADGIAAVEALDERGKPASIQEQNDLFLLF